MDSTQAARKLDKTYFGEFRMIDLSNKNALVTGAALGIGKGISKVLAEQGANVVVSDIDLEGAQRTSEEIVKSGGQAQSAHLDVTSPDAAQSLLSDLLGQLGQIDIVVNNAGVVGAHGWWERKVPNEDDWDAVLAINLRGVVNVSQAVEDSMKERRHGKIINIASIASRQGSPSIPHYNASKAGVVSWTQSHALQLAPYQINVNAICPGLLWTPLFEHLVGRPDFLDNQALEGLTGRERFEKVVELGTPMQKEQTPEDIGKLAAFLASDDAHNITGQAINVDGGRRMN
jgi:NAD(P)-dependent dehydrogenase (short-subunit alcohol dehydrogenase family)